MYKKEDIKIKYGTIPIGSTVGDEIEEEYLKLRRNRFFLDVGNKLCKGAIDVHQCVDGLKIGERSFKSTAAVIIYNQEFIYNNLTEGSSTVEINVHSSPDMDCFAAAYLVKYMIEHKCLPNNYEKLAEYVEDIDSGRVKHDRANLYNPYAIGAVIGELIGRKYERLSAREKDIKVLERGIYLVEYIMQRLEELESGLKDLYNINLLHKGGPFDEEHELLEGDEPLYHSDLSGTFDAFDKERNESIKRKVCEEISIDLPVIDSSEHQRVKGIVWNTTPSCTLHKYWARMEGYVFTFIPAAKKQHVLQDGSVLETNRVIVAVDPNSEVYLSRLGQVLEQAEAIKENIIFGEEKVKWRPYNRKRFDEEWCTNNDPWYDGRNQNYTIVDSPFVGSLLSVEEIKAVVINYFNN
jgi:hypothetical protein